MKGWGAGERSEGRREGVVAFPPESERLRLRNSGYFVLTFF